LPVKLAKEKKVFACSPNLNFIRTEAHLKLVNCFQIVQENKIQNIIIWSE